MGPLVNSISQAQHLQRTSGEHILVGAPQASATKALLRLGNVIVGGSSNGVYFGVNAPSGFLGRLIHLQVNGSDIFRIGATGVTVLSTGSLTLPADGLLMTNDQIRANNGNIGIGVSPSATYRLQVRADADNNTLAGIQIANPNTGTSAAAVLHTSASGASGFVGSFASTHSNALLADRMTIGANSDSLGITYSANASSQDHRWAVGAINEQMRLSADGELLVGTTSSIARLGVVGRVDQVQLRVDAFSTQTTNIIDFRNSAGTSIFTVANNANVLSLGTISAPFLVASSNTAAVNRFGGAAALANTLLSINTGATTTMGLVIRGVASQSANLQEWQTSTPATVASISSNGSFTANSGTFAASVSIPVGTAINPGLRFTADNDVGLFQGGTNVLGFATAGFQRLSLDANGDLQMFRESSTVTRQTATIESGYVVSTDASRTGFLQLQATDFNAVRTFLRGEADGTNPKIGFLGTNAFRATGWGAPTGTATRTTFATGSVTLPQLAERVKALIDDMFTTGYGLLRA